MSRYLAPAIFICAVVLACPQVAHPQSLRLDSSATYSLYRIAQIWNEKGGYWAPAGSFTVTHRASVFHRQRILLRLSIRSDPKVAWVIVSPPQIDRIELLDPDGNVQRNGMRVPFNARPLAYVDPTMAVPARLLDGTPFVVAIETSTEVRDPLLMTAAAAQALDEGTRSVVFFFVGCFAAIGLIVALLYVNLRDRQLVLYALVMVSLVGFEAINKSYAWQYLWPNASLEWHVPNAVAFWSYYAALVLFCCSFLNAQGRRRWLAWTAVAILAIHFPASIAGALVHDRPGVLRTEELLTAALMATLLVWSYYAWRGGQRAARYYVIAFAGVCVGVLVNRLALDQVLPHTWLTEWVFEVGVGWEAVLLALAVASHLNEAAQENALLHASEVQLTTLATLDGLTGLFNRRAFDQRLDSEWNRARRAGRLLAMLLIDVDYFKHYNDSQGHLAGDDCLRRVAAALAAATARGSDFCARYGGEEFAILLAEAELHQAIAFAERIRTAVQELAIPQDVMPSHCVTISVGVAVCQPDEKGCPNDLIAAADRALYGAKNAGRNAVASSAPS